MNTNDDPMSETIRGNADDLRRKIDESKRKTADLQDFLFDESLKRGDVTLFMADFSPEAIRDLFKHVGYGTCHIQQPDGSMKRVEVSIVRPLELKTKPVQADMPKFEPERWGNLWDGSQLSLAKQTVWAHDMPRHVRDWVLKVPWPTNVDPHIHAQRLIEIADRMEVDEPPFVDSDGKPVEWSYLDDNGWPRLANGRLVDVPIVPAQALREDRVQSSVSSLVNAHKTLNKRLNDIAAAAEVARGSLETLGAITGAAEPPSQSSPQLGLVARLRNAWARWMEYLEGNE